MDFFQKPRFWVVLTTVVLSLVLVQQFWQWEVERVEVGPQKYLVRIHRWGKDLPEDEILATNESYKGVMAEMLPEGRYFLNPFEWRTELVGIAEAQCGGASLPPGVRRRRNLVRSQATGIEAGFVGSQDSVLPQSDGAARFLADPEEGSNGDELHPRL